MMNGIYYLPNDFCAAISKVFPEAMRSTGTKTLTYPEAYKLLSEDSKAYGAVFNIEMPYQTLVVSGILDRVWSKFEDYSAIQLSSTFRFEGTDLLCEVYVKSDKQDSVELTVTWV